MGRAVPSAFVTNSAKAIVGLRPSFSAQVRWGEPGAPVAFFWVFGGGKSEQQVPPLRSPGLPLELGGVDTLHAPFPNRKAHALLCPVQRGRKSGYASVGMTLL
jgi:hypothetical protein